MAPIGNALNKLKRMKDFLNYHYRTFKPAKNFLAGSKYTWGTGGKLEFLKDKLVTTWGQGTYTCLENNYARVSWCNYDHIIKCNGASFVSLRLGDLAEGVGEFISNNLYKETRI